MQKYKQYAELETPSYLGVNTASQFSLIPIGQSPRSQNTYQDQIGDISQRPGTKPVTSAALAANVEHLTTYKTSASSSANPEIYAASGVTLYKFNGVDTLTALAMTNNLLSADIYTTGFTNSLLTSRLIIGDGGILKESDGAIVKDVVPATDDASPAPANALVDINAKGCKFVWEYKTQIFISPGTNEIFYSKPKQFDYFPETNVGVVYRENDYVNGQGQAFDNFMLVPLRRGWNIWTGIDFNDFSNFDYLNTNSGVIAPRSIQKVTYPDGTQTIIYLSDDEAHEIFTAINDGGGRQYATRSLMKDKIDFLRLGLTEAEKEGAIGFFDDKRSIYLLSFKKAGVNYTYAYDLRNREWYTDWLTFNAKSYVSLEGVTYFAGNLKHLCYFDEDLYSDWNESTETTGTPVYFKRYSPAQHFEFSGYASFWDAYLLECQQWNKASTLDVTFIFADNTEVMEGAILAEYFVEGVSRWGFAKYANVNFTELVNNPNEILFDFSYLSKYMQVLVENPRDEPVKIFAEKLKGRVSNK